MPSRETADALLTPGADDPVSRPGGFFLVRVFRVPLLLHWSVPAGAVLPSLIVGFSRCNP
ncbi:MAG TPA: hypothetical protein VFS55_16480 [Dokdonella sp.]|nr:hypothetical protein [Dokdonella sp.]